MTLQQFNILCEDKQIRDLMIDGVCIAERKTENTYALLFQLHGFYMEIILSLAADEILFSRTFDDTVELQPYLENVNPIEFH